MIQSMDMSPYQKVITGELTPVQAADLLLKDSVKHIFCRDCGGTVHDRICVDCGEEFFAQWENIIFGLMWFIIIGGIGISLGWGFAGLLIGLREH